MGEVGTREPPRGHRSINGDSGAEPRRRHCSRARKPATPAARNSTTDPPITSFSGSVPPLPDMARYANSAHSHPVATAPTASSASRTETWRGEHDTKILSPIEWFRTQFRSRLYGFDVTGVDYTRPVEPDQP